MKTFFEEINYIVASNKSYNEKVDAIVKIGLNWQEANRVVYNYDNDVKNGRIKVASEPVYTFGIELECGVNYRRVIESDSVNFYYAGYTHATSTRFKFVTDSSVNVGGESIECVSPILKTDKDGFATVKKVCDALNAQDAKVNKSCGYHVHIGAADMPDSQYVNIFRNYQKIEAAVDRMMARSRRGSCRWCKSLAGHDFSDCRNKRDVCHVLHGDRYHKVNPVAYDRHQTVEFRQHQGTTDYTKITNWVKFLVALCEYSRENVISNDISRIEDIPFLKADLIEYYKGRAEELA